jgi:hypothetical protein
MLKDEIEKNMSLRKEKKKQMDSSESPTRLIFQIHNPLNHWLGLNQETQFNINFPK